MTTPAPNASPTAVPPVSTTTSPPSSSSSPSSPSNNSSLPSQSIPNQNSDAPPPTNSFTLSNSSSPPLQSPPPVASSAPPPSPPLSSPPPVPPPTSSPAPSPPTLPSSPASPPPTINVPPPPNSASPPPSNLVPPPPPPAHVPPQESPVPPLVTPPPSVAVPPSPPPPANVPSPPSINAPPPGPQMRTGSSPPPPSLVPPSTDSPPAPPPSTSTPSGSSLSPPPSVPSSSLTPPISPAPPSDSSANRNPPNSPLPSIPTEKPTAKPTTPISNSTGLNTIGTVTIAVVLSFLALSLVVMTIWYIKRRKRREPRFSNGYIVPSPFASSQKSDSSFLRPQHASQLAASYSGNNFMFSPEHRGLGNSKSWFTYEELAEATNKFSVNNLLGEGGFGCVYNGILPDGREIAVKQLKIGGGQGEREFRAEVEIISRVHHRHLVSLIGYCISEHQRLLVYDYVPNNTLHYHLHGEDRQVMDWATRVKVAAGAARGIAYLHEDCDPRIIHRDIKSSNILLDNNFEAQVADFGLAKLALDADTHVTTRVMGTFGYLAPEYALTGKLTEKSDVFSFGVVLLELITGRKPVDTSQPLGDEGLVGWARPLLTQALDGENLEELVDPRLENNFVENEMFRMVEAAAACVRHSASKRPRMSQVVRALDSIAELSDITNGMKPGQSEVFDSREQSAQIRMFQRMLAGSQDYSSDLFIPFSGKLEG